MGFYSSKWKLDCYDTLLGHPVPQGWQQKTWEKKGQLAKDWEVFLRDPGSVRQELSGDTYILWGTDASSHLTLAWKRRS